MSCKPVTFTVTGRGAFPYDMLRYDACWPHSGEDASKLAPEPLGRGVRHVRLDSHYGSAPTIGRWESFGWLVTASSSTG